MKQVVSTPDGVKIVDVSPPELAPGTLLVRTAFSCVSPGTELAGIRSAEVPLWRRVIRDPRKAVRRASSLVSGGVASARREVAAARSVMGALGYSASGSVIQVAADVVGFAPGDRVACAGAGVASHAEVLCVPMNLAVHVPDDVELEDAAVTTIAAIALQGVRRFAPTLGETVAVVGLGVLGQLTCQMLRANGCGVVAIDVDSARVDMARAAGVLGVLPGEGDVLDRVSTLTLGVGVDGVIITASTDSSEVVSEAFRMTRSRGRVVIVGDVGLDLQRADMYERELELRMSTSYGPGRYDRRYEEDGLEYPLGHVRWTENRNMQAVLGLMAEGTLDVRPLIGSVHALDEAPAAFASLSASSPRPMTVVLAYPTSAPTNSVPKTTATVGRKSRGGRLGVGVLGSGSFATEVHLPNLLAHPRVDLVGLAARTPIAVEAAAQRFGAPIATTDPTRLLEDDRIDALVICTRHDSHATLVEQALLAGKHVLVEKPLALTDDELDRVAAVVEAHPDTLLLVGFNRRFSPAVTSLRQRVEGRGDPMVMTYRMNAGFLPTDHWVFGPEGGGRNIGEACHVYDVLRSLAGAPSTVVHAASARPGPSKYRPDDNFVVTLSYGDGSVANLVYTAFGDQRWPKEQLTVFVEGQVLEVDDYRSLRSSSGDELWSAPMSDKGHRAELDAFVGAVLDGGSSPIPIEELLEVSRTAIDVEAQLRGHMSEL